MFDLALYLGVLGGAAAPLAIASLYRGARAGSSRDAAFLATFVSASVTGIAVVAAFSASQFGLGRLHDRYLFYVVPLWLAALAAWVARGAARSHRLAVVSAAAFVIFDLVMPYGRLVVPDGARMFDGTGTAVWARLGGWLATSHGVSGRWALPRLRSPRRSGWSRSRGGSPGPCFLSSRSRSWRVARSCGSGRWTTRTNGSSADTRSSTRGWVDRAVPAGAKVTLLTDYAGACHDPLWRYSFLFTEFFNERIEQVPYVGGPLYGRARRRTGSTSRETARSRREPHAAACDLRRRPSWVEVAGRRLAVGTSAPLVLWRTRGGTVRLVGAGSEAAVAARACS